MPALTATATTTTTTTIPTTQGPRLYQLELPLRPQSRKKIPSSILAAVPSVRRSRQREGTLRRPIVQALNMDRFGFRVYLAREKEDPSSNTVSTDVGAKPKCPSSCL